MIVVIGLTLFDPRWCATDSLVFVFVFVATNLYSDIVRRSLKSDGLYGLALDFQRQYMMRPFLYAPQRAKCIRKPPAVLTCLITL